MARCGDGRTAFRRRIGSCMKSYPDILAAHFGYGRDANDIPALFLTIARAEPCAGSTYCITRHKITSVRVAELARQMVSNYPNAIVAYDSHG